MYISFGNIYEAFSGLALEHLCLMHLLFCIYVVSWVSGSSLQQWLCEEAMDAVTTAPTMTLALVTKGGIKGFLSGSGDRKVPETFIISVILCPSSQITCLGCTPHFIQEKGCVLLKPSYLTSSIPKTSCGCELQETSRMLAELKGEGSPRAGRKERRRRSFTGVPLVLLGWPGRVAGP